MWIYLTVLNCSLKSGKGRKFYIICFLLTTLKKKAIINGTRSHCKMNMAIAESLKVKQYKIVYYY